MHQGTLSEVIWTCFVVLLKQIDKSTEDLSLISSLLSQGTEPCLPALTSNHNLLYFIHPT